MRDETRLRFYVGDIEIYHFYFGDFSLTEKYESPFPHRNDPNPSFMFKNIGSYSNPKIIWNDFGMDDIKYKDGIGFVMMFYGLNRSDAVRKIWNEMVRDKDTRIIKPRISHPIKLPYEFGEQPLQDWEMVYWRKLYFNESFMKFFNVWSLKYIRRVDKVIWKSEKDNPTYIYLFSKQNAFKAYRPLDPDKDKFRGQNNGDILEGYDQLPKTGDVLFITSSLKDTMTLRRMGLLGINPTSENSKRALYLKIRELNQRFSKIYILFDNDGPGIKSALNLANDTGWEPVFIPKYLSKDPSDLVMKTKNYFELINIFKPLKTLTYHV